MYIKEIAKPSYVLKYESLSSRLMPDHENFARIEELKRGFVSGYKGERAVSYYLDFLPEKDFFIFHDLRLPSGKYHFQLDILLLTTRYALILECKNYKGTLIFDADLNQMIRELDGKQEGFSDPISQGSWHRKQLLQFLKPLPLPVDFFVIISKPSTIVELKKPDKFILDKVVHGHRLLEKIESFDRRFQKEILDAKELRKLSRRLLKGHTPYSFSLEKYNVTEKHIITGVQCYNCGTFGMKYKSGVWTCGNCLKKCKKAHAETLKEYAILFDPFITNREFRRFLHVDSDNVAKHLLRGLSLPFTGENKGRKYQLDKLLESR